MKNKNKKLMIAIGSLLVVIGVSFAYFVSTVLLNGNGSSTGFTIATIKGSELQVVGDLEFSDLDIYPGHINVSSVKVTATGDNELIPYNVIWNGTNTLNTSLNYTIYKTSSVIDTSTSCEKQKGVVDGALRYYEECSISNIDNLGTEIASGTINTNDTKVILVQDEFITSSPTGDEVYYYVILEYPNLEDNQNSDIGGSFVGKVTLEISDAEPDINIIAAYIKQEDGTYKEVSDIPQEGYTLNAEKSVCSNGASVRWDYNNKELITSNLTKSGTSCYLYFDELYLAKDVILADRTIEERNLPFNVNTSFEGSNNIGDIYRTNDWSGTSYYFAGNPNDNWVKFAGFYWRIIRINGNGSIRIIYSGNSNSGPVVTGSDTQITIDGSNVSVFNLQENYTYYVGLSYDTTQHGIGTSNTVLDKIERWYATNLASYEDNIDVDIGFCSDREMSKGYTWSAQPTEYIFYASDGRLVRSENNVRPSLDCSNRNDILKIPAGLITADEVTFGGISYRGNTNNNYLFTAQDYWTMTPCNANQYGTTVYFVESDGVFRNRGLSETAGIRPVINLKNDVELTGSGTTTDPYVVVGAE